MTRQLAPRTRQSEGLSRIRASTEGEFAGGAGRSVRPDRASTSIVPPGSWPGEARPWARSFDVDLAQVRLGQADELFSAPAQLTVADTYYIGPLQDGRLIRQARRPKQASSTV
jgi:hypothetical protein